MHALSCSTPFPTRFDINRNCLSPSKQTTSWRISFSRIFRNRDMTDPNDDPRIYFAAERTFLAWIRTGLALMGIGFAVARFGLFLQQLRLVPGMVVSRSGVSVHSGVALVVLGVTVNVVAAIHHV